MKTYNLSLKVQGTTNKNILKIKYSRKILSWNAKCRKNSLILIVPSSKLNNVLEGNPGCEEKDMGDVVSKEAKSSKLFIFVTKCPQNVKSSYQAAETIRHHSNTITTCTLSIIFSVKSVQNGSLLSHENVFKEEDG